MLLAYFRVASLVSFSSVLKLLLLSKCLVTGIPSLIGSSWEKEYPSLTVRACDGLSWDTPVGIDISKAVPTVMGRWEFVNVQL